MVNWKWVSNGVFLIALFYLVNSIYSIYYVFEAVRVGGANNLIILYSLLGPLVLLVAIIIIAIGLRKGLGQPFK